MPFRKSKGWGSAKPPSGASITGPSALGLEFLHLNQEGQTFYDCVTKTFASTVTTAPTIVASAGGPAMYFGSQSWPGNTKRSTSNSTSVSAVLVIDDKLNSSVNNQVMLADYDGGTTYHRWRISLDDASVVYNGFGITMDNTGTYIAQVRTTGLNVYGFVLNSGSDVRLFINGRFVSSTANAGTINTDTHSKPQVNGLNSSFGVKYVSSAWWNRQIPDGEMQSITASPNAFYSSLILPPRRRIISAVAAAGGFTAVNRRTTGPRVGTRSYY